MNSSKLTSHLRADPMWEEKHVKNCLVSDLTIADDEGQSRQAGIIPSHVEKLVEDILARTLQVPITIDDNNVVVEGNHRLKAYEALSNRYPENPRWQLIKAYQRSFKTEADRRAYQLDSNSHVPAKANAKEDYAQTVNSDLKGGFIKGMEWGSFNDDSGNFNKLVDYVHKAYKHLGVGKNSAKAIAKIAASEAPNGKVKNYTKDELVKEFDLTNSLGWSGKKSGDVSNDVAVYALGNATHIFPNLTGNSFNKKTSDDRVATTTVVWQSNTFGLDGSDLDCYRANVIKRINKANKSWLLSPNAKLVDEVFIAPQKLREGEENGKKFFRVKKKSNGEFDASSIPTSGWK